VVSQAPWWGWRRPWDAWGDWNDAVLIFFLSPPSIGRFFGKRHWNLVGFLDLLLERLYLQYSSNWGCNFSLIFSISSVSRLFCVKKLKNNRSTSFLMASRCSGLSCLCFNKFDLLSSKYAAKVAGKPSSSKKN